MPNPTSISLLNYGFRADASVELLTVMLNCPEIDYSTDEELHHCVKLSHFTQEGIDNAISELKSRKFLHKVQKTYGSVFAVNKLYTVNMMFDYEREVNENGQAEKKKDGGKYRRRVHKLVNMRFQVIVPPIDLNFSIGIYAPLVW